jgi:hypothetical protein
VVSCSPAPSTREWGVSIMPAARFDWDSPLSRLFLSRNIENGIRHARDACALTLIAADGAGLECYDELAGAWRALPLEEGEVAVLVGRGAEALRLCPAAAVCRHRVRRLWQRAGAGGGGGGSAASPRRHQRTSIVIDFYASAQEVGRA